MNKDKLEGDFVVKLEKATGLAPMDGTWSKTLSDGQCKLYLSTDKEFNKSKPNNF